MKLKSRVAMVFFIVGLLVLLAGAFGAIEQIRFLDNMYEQDYPVQDVTSQYATVFLQWLLDPIYIALSAFIIEFLERIWIELKSRNQNP